MLKAIALAGIFLFPSAVSTAALKNSTKPITSSQPAPTSPQPQGFCLPPGARC